MRPSPRPYQRGWVITSDACTGERGSTVLESAVGIAALVGVGAAIVWAASLGLCAAQASFTAREAARSLARGEDPRAVLAQAEHGSDESQDTIEGDASTVTVIVERDVAPGGLLRGFTVTVRQAATAWRER